jgi:hypothetical protein
MEQKLRVEQKIEREMLRDNLGERNQNTTQFRHDWFFVVVVVVVVVVVHRVCLDSW